MEAGVALEGCSPLASSQAPAPPVFKPPDEKGTEEMMSPSFIRKGPGF